MPVRDIVRLGHPALRSQAERVKPARLADREVQEAIDDLVETLRASPGVGLAAPQIGAGWQIFAYEAIGDERTGGEEIPLKIVVDPMIVPQSGEMVYDWEGCLSIPGLRGLVPRHPAVGVRALDRDGRPVSYVAEGFEARIVQHEYDHLNGIIFLDRMRDLRSLSYDQEWEELIGSGPGHEITAVG